VILRHPCVKEAAVIGILDQLRGEVVKCFVVLKDGIVLPTSYLMDYLRDNLAKFKLPKEIEYLNELPKTGSGKVNKAALREMEENKHK